MKKIFCIFEVILLILSGVFLLTSCTYDPPEGFTEEHHTYEEICEFAKKLDGNATVSDEYTETVEKAGTIEYAFREWPAVINGIECHIASAPDWVSNEGFLGGEFPNRYYRIDTDYDYYLLEKILREERPEWKLSAPSDGQVLLSRYNWNHVLSVDTSYCKSDRLTDDELEVFWQEVLEINEMFIQYPVSDRLFFNIRAPMKCYDGARSVCTLSK